MIVSILVAVAGPVRKTPGLLNDMNAVGFKDSAITEFLCSDWAGFFLVILAIITLDHLPGYQPGEIKGREHKPLFFLVHLHPYVQSAEAISQLVADRCYPRAMILFRPESSSRPGPG